MRISLFDLDGAADTLNASETITAAVIGVPAVDTKTVALNASDISFAELKETTAGGEKDYVIDNAVVANTDGAFGSVNSPVSDGAQTYKNSVYALALLGASGTTSSVIDKGYYTVRFRLSDSTGFIVSEKTLKIQWVSSEANAGASIAVTTTGSIQKV